VSRVRAGDAHRGPGVYWWKHGVCAYHPCTKAHRPASSAMPFTLLEICPVSSLAWLALRLCAPPTPLRSWSCRGCGPHLACIMSGVARMPLLTRRWCVLQSVDGVSGHSYISQPSPLLYPQQGTTWRGNLRAPRDAVARRPTWSPSHVPR